MDLGFDWTFFVHRCRVAGFFVRNLAICGMGLARSDIGVVRGQVALVLGCFCIKVQP